MIIELLQGSFPKTENPGLESTDPRFDEIVTLVQAGKQAEAAAQSEAILADGIYDIRLICYYLYGYWLDKGLASLFEVMNCLNNIILENSDAIGPVANRDKIFEKSLDWLFRQVLKKIQYEQKKNTLLWQQWQDCISEDELNKIWQSGETFCSSINNSPNEEARDLVNLWRKLEEWLKVLQQLIYHQPVITQTEAEKPADDFQSIGLAVVETAIPVAIDVQALASKVNGVGAESSYHMALLIKKLAAFELLLQQEKLLRAALVMDDINQTLCTFDPKLYLPKMFETFVRLQALNIEELSVCAEQRDTLEWQVMQEWLKVDLDSFINS